MPHVMDPSPSISFHGFKTDNGDMEARDKETNRPVLD